MRKDKKDIYIGRLDDGTLVEYDTMVRLKMSAWIYESYGWTNLGHGESYTINGNDSRGMKGYLLKKPDTEE